MSPTDLKATAIRGTRFTVLARLFRALQGIAALSILSRFLSPAEFGAISLVTFVAGIAQIFTDFGTRIAIVQKRDVTKLQEDSVFWWNLGIGAILTAGTFIFSHEIARLMGDENVSFAMRCVSPIFLLGALQGVPQSILERRLAFGTIAIAEVSAAVSSSLCAIGMVLVGFKFEALIVQQVVAPLITASVIVISARWRPNVQFSYPALKPLLSYGGYVTAAGIVAYLAGTADRPIVGNRLSITDLGYLGMSSQIVMSPLRITVQMVRKVMFPIMATIQDDDARMRRGYIAMQHGLMVVMAPIAFGLWAVATPVVALLLGPKWAIVATLMGFLTIRSVFTTFNDLNTVVFGAKGWARFQFRWSIFSAIISVGTLLLTVDYGVVAIVAGRLAATILLTPLNSYFAFKLISQRPGEVISALCRVRPCPVR